MYQSLLDFDCWSLNWFLQWHPDKNKGGHKLFTKVFQVLNNAYACLFDPKERAIYDSTRTDTSDVEKDFPTAKASPQPRSTTSAEIFPSGTVVSLRNLTAEFLLDLNDSRGTIISYDAESGQYVVALEDTAQEVKVEGFHLLCLEKPKARPPAKPFRALPHGTVVSLRNLSVRTDLNGRFGKVDRYDAHSGRYLVILSTSNVVKVRPSNVIRLLSQDSRPLDHTAKRSDVLPSGTIIFLRNLKMRADLNGLCGKIQRYDAQADRYVVCLDNCAEELHLKSCNLLQPGRVVLVNLETSPEFNGCRGIIIGWNPVKQRYAVHIMEHKKVELVKPENVVLANGTIVRIVSKRSEWNGRYGFITGYKNDTSLHVVRLSPRLSIAAKVLVAQVLAC
jgi:DnaJ domain